MHSHIPHPIQPMIEEYTLTVKKQLPNLVNAFYLVGSIALDEFNEHFSDVDFVAILNRNSAPGEIKALRDIHRVIERDHPKWKMSGSYIRADDLGKLEDAIQPHLHYHDGVLHSNARDDVNSVTWWELKNHGIAVMGAEPHNLPLTVDLNVLLTKMLQNMNSYWASWTNLPVRMLTLYSNWGIQWAVLGVLRQFYTFQENSITTKIRAGKYALGCLPTRWHKLIQEAIDIREGKKVSAYRCRTVRLIEAVNFLKYIIQLCNHLQP